MTYGSKSWREWVLEEEESRPFVKRALELGINFFDTADMYSNGVSEQILGRAIKDFATSRDDVVIATKCYFPVNDKPNRGGLSRKHIFEAIDTSLKNLGMNYVDLYQIHRYDKETPIEETLEALHDLVRIGKVRYIGASSMFAWQFARAQYIADKRGLTRFISMQNHYNLVYREEEREMNPLCATEGVGLIPWSPLARGFLAGNRPKPTGDAQKGGETLRAKTDDYAHKMYYRDDDYQVLEAVQAIAKARGVTNSQIALAWLLHQSCVSSPIIGASKMNQLEEAVTAVSIKLTPEELTKLTAPYKPHPVLGHS
jgi:aryl-alcohol dehydrogenase-like predicted oxidoreductase